MLTKTPYADIRKDGCHGIYMNISKYQYCFPEYECDIFFVKKIWYIRVFPIFCHCPSVQKWFAIFLWKLICCNINRRHIFLVLNLSLCNHNSGWMPCLISFIYGFRRAVRNGKRKVQNENMCLRRESNQRPLAFQRVALTTWLSGQLTTGCKNFCGIFYATININQYV